jgi:U3 small nucleolar RNA-associated protein 13
VLGRAKFGAAAARPRRRRRRPPAAASLPARLCLAQLVDPATGAVSATIPGDSEPVTALALSPDGRVVYAASRSLQVRAFDLSGSGSAAAAADGAAAPPPRELRAFRGHRAPVAAMAVHPSGGLLATASADRSARVWDADGGFCTHALTGHAGVVLAVAFHPTELLLLTGGDDAQVRFRILGF